MLEFILERGNYWAIIGLMMIGLYIAFASTNLIKRLIGLGLFQTSIILFYISLSRIDGGTAPILFGKDYKKDKGHGDGDGYGDAGEHAGDAAEHGAHAADAAYGAAKAYGEAGMANVYSNPLPHVLMLTAIVVGVATLAVGLAIIVRIREAYGTVEADEIRAMDLEVAIAEAAADAEQRKAGAA
ncbi:MAG: cation:proton antiporter subunit C [Henriciella sp.]|nr:cation:proton antiporter subunit C [Henriciella sp.]